MRRQTLFTKVIRHRKINKSNAGLNRSSLATSLTNATTNISESNKVSFVLSGWIYFQGFSWLDCPLRDWEFIAIYSKFYDQTVCLQTTCESVDLNWIQILDRWQCEGLLGIIIKELNGAKTHGYRSDPKKRSKIVATRCLPGISQFPDNITRLVRWASPCKQSL